MSKETTQQCTAFEGHRCIASGELIEVARKVKEVIDRGEKEPILIFGDSDSEIVEIDFRGTVDDVVAKLEKPAADAAPAEVKETAPRGPGRPKLGVVSREVTLLPRHWDWLNSQPGGASVTLRKLVEEARRVNSGRDTVRQAQETTYRFMQAMAGDLPGFEEATRSLDACGRERFNSLINAWPPDIREHVQKLAEDVWG